MPQPTFSIAQGGLLAIVLGSSPSGSENALLVRNIPSGTQTVSGTITIGAGAAAIGSITNTGFNLTGIAKGTSTALNATVKSVDANTNAIDVNIASGGSSGVVADATAWTAGATTFMPLGGVFNDSATALTSGQEGTARLTAQRGMHVNVRDASGNAVTVTSGGLDINIKSGSIANTSFIATQSTPAAHGNYFWNKITDGTNDATVTAGGALNVTIASALPTGGNAIGSITNTSFIATQTTPGVHGNYFWNKLTDGTNDVTVTASGALNVAIATAAATTTAGSLGSLNAVLAAAATAYDTALVTLKGTFAGVTVQFWISDDSGTTYYAAQAVRTDTNVSGSSFVLADNSSTSYFVNVAGATNIQVKASAYTSGSVTARISPNGSSFSPIVVAGLATGANAIGSITNTSFIATQSTPAAHANYFWNKLTDGTNDATVTAGGALNVTIASALPTGANAIGSITNTSFIATQSTPAAHGNYFWNKLTDGTNDATVTAGGALNVTVASALPTGANAIGSITNTGFNLTGIAKGTSTALNATVKAVDANTNAADVAINGTVTVTGTVTSNIGTTNGLALDATLTGGTVRTKITDGSNNSAVVNAAPASSAYGLVVRNLPADYGASFNNITTNATTTVKSGAGVLHKIVLNSDGDLGQTATIYDNTAGSGTKIGTLSLSSGVGTFVYGLAFATGLTIVTAGGTTLADITVIYS